MMSEAFLSLVSRKVAMGGGICFDICEMSSSAITPGPLGILPTSPRASAPCFMARKASSKLLIQQILILGRFNVKVMLINQLLYK
jgi:hypothetical protein